eukprot:maker-scaffold25_size650667-snap-gene-1.19 protein:Tk06690 transcript:maker-scaffold25_size650667-snap-gene-1.19-mRNA-1 annotation:"2"
MELKNRLCLRKSLLSLLLLWQFSTLASGLGIGARNQEDYHRVYQLEAKPYSNVNFNKELPYVPRYRYPISAYVGKRMSENDAYFTSNPNY